jgi:hypothetical protein
LNERLDIGFVVEIVSVDCSVADEECGARYIATLGRGGIGGRIEGVPGGATPARCLRGSK